MGEVNPVAPPTQPPDPFAGLDPGIAGEITAWQTGGPPPPRLLQFPDGPPALARCGMTALGAAVGDYVCRIRDDELLRALLFDPRADTACVRAVARRLVERHGLGHVRDLLAERRRTTPADFARTELATLAQLVTSSYVRVRAVSVRTNDAAEAVADRALAGLAADLAAGVPWERAYLAAAEVLFDRERSQREHGGWRTFLCYRYDGLISPTGFDLLDRRISDQLDPRHVRAVFDVKAGVHRLDTADAYWLFDVEAFYEAV